MGTIACLGCARQRQQTASAHSNIPQIKQLLSKSDSLEVVDEYSGAVYSEQKKPDEVSGPYKIRTIYDPGFVSLTPVVATDPATKNIVKGVVVGLRSERWSVDGHDGGGDGAKLYLDEDEMHDLDKAVEFIQATTAQWNTQSIDHPTRIVFHTKDGLNIEVTRGAAPEILVGSDTDSRAIIVIDPHRLDELKADTRKVCDTLASHPN